MVLPGRPYAYYIRSVDTDTFVDISDRIGTAPKWEITLNLEPIQFTLSVKNPINHTTGKGVYIQTGDEILVCENSFRENIVLYGQVVNPNRQPYTYDENTKEFNIFYDLECEEFDFSSVNLFSIVQQVPVFLSDLLDQILLGTSTKPFPKRGYIGGVLSDGTTLGRYRLANEDITVDSLILDCVSAREALSELCRQNGLRWKLEHFVQPDATDVAEVFSRVVVLDAGKSESPNKESSWFNGIDLEVYRRGSALNPRYAFDTTQPQFDLGERDWKFEENLDDIRNYIDCIIPLQDGELTRFEEISTELKKTYDLKSPSLQIVYATRNAFKGGVLGIATDKLSITTDASFLARLELGDIIRIPYTVPNSNGNDEEFFAVDSITSSEVGFASALPDPIEVIDSYIEVVQQVTHPLYDDNIINDEDELRNPVFGILLKAETHKDAKIEFLEFSEPSPGDNVVAYFKRIVPNNEPRILHDSIDRYGIRRYHREFKEVMDIKQARRLLDKLESPDPNMIISFTTWREDAMEVGWQLDVKLDEDVLNTPASKIIPLQKMVCISVVNEVVKGFHPKSKKPVVKQEVTLATQRESLQDILNEFAKRPIFRQAGLKYEKQKFSERVQILEQDLRTETASPSSPVDYDTSLATPGFGIYLREGSTLTDFIDSNNGTYAGSAAVTSVYFRGRRGMNFPGGVNDYVSIPHATNYQSTTTYTFKFIVRPQLAITTTQWLMTKYHFTNSSKVEFQVFFANDKLSVIYYSTINGTSPASGKKFFRADSPTLSLTLGTYYGFIISIDITGSPDFHMTMNQTTLSHTVATGGNAISLAALAADQIQNGDRQMVVGTRDRDATSKEPFDGEMHRLMVIPVWTPRANAIAEHAAFSL